MRAEILVEVDEYGKVLIPMRDVLRATHHRVVVEDTRVVLYPMEIVTPDALVTDSDGYTERQRQAVNGHACPTCAAWPEAIMLSDALAAISDPTVAATRVELVKP